MSLAIPITASIDLLWGFQSSLCFGDVALLICTLYKSEIILSLIILCQSLAQRSVIRRSFLMTGCHVSIFPFHTWGVVSILGNADLLPSISAPQDTQIMSSKPSNLIALTYIKMNVLELSTFYINPQYHDWQVRTNCKDMCSYMSCNDIHTYQCHKSLTCTNGSHCLLLILFYIILVEIWNLLFFPENII